MPSAATHNTRCPKRRAGELTSGPATPPPLPRSQCGVFSAGTLSSDALTPRWPDTCERWQSCHWRVWSLRATLMNMNRIQIAIYPGFDEVDAAGPFEVLSNVTRAHPEVNVELVGVHGPGEIVASHGMRVLCAEKMSDATDLILIPGGGWANGGVRAQYGQGTLADRLRDFHDGGITIASVCTGAMLLGQAGILSGRPATTHHSAFDYLAEQGAIVDRHARVVDDGDVLTCGGVTSGLDLAFHLVEREWGAELAGHIATAMEYERRGPVRTPSSATTTTADRR
jgi:transcriptional regulator GlxA family with amidase domain